MPDGQASAPGRRARGVLRPWAALACGLALGAGLGPAAALGIGGGVPDQASLDLGAMLEAFEPAPGGAPAVIAAAGLESSAGTLGEGGSALPDLPRPGIPVEARRLPTRLGLLMLSQAHGEDGNQALAAAQGDPSQDSLVLTAGQATLADLRRLLEAEGLGHETVGSTLTLRVPLVLWGEASLRLGPGEALELSRPDGAFVLNFGQLDLDGAALSAVGDENVGTRSFVPFLVTAEGGALRLRGARLTGLGFGDLPKFSGVAVLGSLTHPERASLIQDSLIEDVLTVTIQAAPGTILRGNHFRDPRGSALTVARSQGVRILSNVFSGVMTTNAIRMENGSTDALIAGNVLLGGDRAGILVRAGSGGAVIEGNVVWRRDGGGIALVDSDCARVSGNLVIDNAQKGIELRASLGSEVRGNTVYSNQSAGIWVSDQAPGTVTEIVGNVVAFNGAGLAGAGAGALLLEANDLSRQFQQFLSGDLALQTAHLARDMRGGAPLALTASGRLDPVPDLAVAAAACSR